MSASSRYMPSKYFINSLKDSDFKERLVHFNGTVVFLLLRKSVKSEQSVFKKKAPAHHCTGASN